MSDTVTLVAAEEIRKTQSKHSAGPSGGGAGRVLEPKVQFYAHWTAGYARQQVKQTECIVNAMRQSCCASWVEILGTPDNSTPHR